MWRCFKGTRTKEVRTHAQRNAVRYRASFVLHRRELSNTGSKSIQPCLRSQIISLTGYHHSGSNHSRGLEAIHGWPRLHSLRQVGLAKRFRKHKACEEKVEQ